MMASCCVLLLFPECMAFLNKCESQPQKRNLIARTPRSVRVARAPTVCPSLTKSNIADLPCPVRQGLEGPPCLPRELSKLAGQHVLVPHNQACRVQHQLPHALAISPTGASTMSPRESKIIPKKLTGCSLAPDRPVCCPPCPPPGLPQLVRGIIPSPNITPPYPPNIKYSPLWSILRNIWAISY